MKKINWQYTFGEILIVIIGISIAFSLNKCSETQQNNEIQQRYLENLKDDIETDKKNLEANLARLNEKSKLLSSTFQYFNPKVPKRDSLLMLNFFKSAEVIEFSPKTTTHETLINSGDLKLISNFELKTAIQEHYRAYGELQQDYDRMENISKEYIADYFIHNIDMDKFRTGQKAYSNEPLLKSIVYSMRGAIGLKIQSTKEGIASCDQILTQLDEAIK